MHNMPQISYQTERSDQGMREHLSDGRPVWNQVIKKLKSGIDIFPINLTFTSDFLTARSRFSLGICSSWPRVWPTSVLEFSSEPGNTGCGNGNPRKCLSLPSCPLGCYTLLVTLSGKGRMIRRWWRWSGGTKKFRCIHSPIHSRTCAIWDSPLMKTRSSSRTLPSAQVCVNMSFSVI